MRPPLTADEVARALRQYDAWEARWQLAAKQRGPGVWPQRWLCVLVGHAWRGPSKIVNRGRHECSRCRAYWTLPPATPDPPRGFYSWPAFFAVHAPQKQER